MDRLVSSIVRSRYAFIVVLLLGLAGTVPCAGASDYDQPRQTMTEAGRHAREAGDSGGVLFLFGAFCALWAQNTRRNAWLWFFAGMFFSVITVIVLLVKNSDENFELKQYGRTSLGRRAPNQ